MDFEIIKDSEHSFIYEQPKTALSRSDVRIGNIVFDDEGLISKIEGIESKELTDRNGDGDGIIIKRDGRFLETSMVSGIPIKPSWLNYIVKVNRIGNQFNWTINNRLEVLLGDYEVTLDFIHELQNLFFAINANELVIEIE